MNHEHGAYSELHLLPAARAFVDASVRSLLYELFDMAKKCEPIIPKELLHVAEDRHVLAGMARNVNRKHAGIHG